MRCFSTRAMKSAGVYRASADLAKCGFAEKKFSGRQWRFVKLQRPPPEIRIFLPARLARSRTATRRPRLPASIAHISPAAPAPRITASNLWTMIGKGVRPKLPRTIIAFLPWDWTGIAIVTQGLEFQTFAISRIDFVDWTFHKAGVTFNTQYLRTGSCVN